MSIKTKKILFRADASAEIGGGHIFRCLTLANVLNKQGWECIFAVDKQTILTIPDINKSVCKVLVLECDEIDEAEFIAGKLINGVDVLVVDHYKRENDFEVKCRSWATSVFVIDDLANRKHDCDLLLDPTYNREQVSYLPYVPQQCNLLLGSHYSLIRPVFSELRKTSLARRKLSKDRVRLLVTMGLTDPFNITSMIIDAIKESNLKLTIDVVLGSGAPYLSEVQNALNGIKMPVNFYIDTDEMDLLMLEADIAIGAAGSTSWERCCLGVPTILIVTADNQLEIARQLSESGAAVLLGRYDEITKKQIVDQLDHLSKNTSLLADLTKNSSRVTDGLGVFRVSKTLDEMVAAS